MSFEEYLGTLSMLTFVILPFVWGFLVL